MADWRKRDVLKWPQRMGITMGIAKGIQYLHTGGVTGNDIKLENVLLDETLTARISCYNISLPSKVMLVNHKQQYKNLAQNALLTIQNFYRLVLKVLLLGRIN